MAGEGDGEGEGQGEGQGNKIGSGKPLSDHDWEERFEAFRREEKRQLERDIDEAIRQGALAAGNLVAVVIVD